MIVLVAFFSVRVESLGRHACIGSHCVSRVVVAVPFCDGEFIGCFRGWGVLNLASSWKKRAGIRLAGDKIG